MDCELRSSQKDLHQRKRDHLYTVFGRKGCAFERGYNMNPSSMLKDSAGTAIKALRGTKQKSE